eukprot:scaffold124832_cov42-Phaeocystis_antarctica.AAC.1
MARPTGSTGTQTAAAAVESPAGFSTATRQARPRPATSMGTGPATASGPTTSQTTRPRLHRASPRGTYGATQIGRTRA